RPCRRRACRTTLKRRPTERCAWRPPPGGAALRPLRPYIPRLSRAGSPKPPGTLVSVGRSSRQRPQMWREEIRMRTTRIGVGVAIVGAALWTQLAMAGSAAADGGAYIELNRTYYQPGNTAIEEAYVAIPKS